MRLHSRWFRCLLALAALLAATSLAWSLASFSSPKIGGGSQTGTGGSGSMPPLGRQDRTP